MSSFDLVVMAAGAGSRFGGKKQFTSVGPRGEFVMDYSIQSAKKAGCSGVVLIIPQDSQKLVTDKYEKEIDDGFLRFVSQTMPEGTPSSRVKPWGTGQALLCAVPEINSESALVINADDFYGEEAFKVAGEWFAVRKEKNNAMVAYQLDETLSLHGSVSRGICETKTQGDKTLIQTIRETHGLVDKSDGNVVDDSGKKYPSDTPVSMNFWLIGKESLVELPKKFNDFFQANVSSEKAEFYLPSYILGEVQSGRDCEMLSGGKNWMGLTYAEDLYGLSSFLSKEESK